VAANARQGGDESQTGPGGENLDKVRDILFGAQLRDSDRRFVRMEETFTRQVTELREENRKRLDQLEGFVKKELQSLVDRLKAEQGQRGEALKAIGQDIKGEQSARNEALKGIAQELRDTTKSITEQLRAAEERASESQRELRQEILDLSKGLRDEVQQASTTAVTTAQRATEQLRDEKADRAALADLFTEMAMRLNNDGETNRK
jgi:hypothetical protein